jgi:citrate synthase
MVTKTSRWITTQQAADLLGVKAETVYAYVSRGLLRRHRGEDRRSSRFDRLEIERLAKRNRRGGRAGSLEVVIDSELTMIDPAGGLYYRGHDALDLARTRRFEEVAELLWAAPPVEDPTADDAEPLHQEAGPVAEVAGPAALGRTHHEPWMAPTEAVRAASRAQDALPATSRTIDRLRVVVAALAATEPMRDDRRPGAVAATARSLVAGAVDALPALSPLEGTSIAERLWSRLADRSPRRGEVRALDAALTLVADHELAASTLAARIAASVRADPYLVVLTGLAAGGGILHGASSLAVEALLRDAGSSWQAPGDVARLVGERLRRGEQLPGFGHAVYTGRDPRADALLQLVGAVEPQGAVDATVAELLDVAGRHGGPAPNVDFALGALVVKAGLAPGSGEVIFLLGRMAGVVAHALEEYVHRLRFRPRALYTGPAPRT